MTRTRATKQLGAASDQMAAMASVVEGLKGFKPAPAVITKVQAVPTIFAQYDRVTKVSGHPLARVTLVHGPSNEGKTVFTTGLGLSFLKRGHFYGLVDAEMSTPVEWLSELMGQYSHHPGFVALPASTYEETVDAVRDFCEKVAEARARKTVAPETTALIVVDSLRKLVPKKMMALLEKGAAKNGVDGIGGRAGQIKAAMNAAWMDELVPLMASTNCAIALISRETEDPNAGLYDEGIKIGGGKAVFYDSSIACRITRSFIPHPVEEQAKRGAMVGERHQIEIRKTRVGKKDTRRPRAYFHTSNGALSPAGFDAARDLLELGEQCGVIDRSGSWYSYDGAKLGNGEVAALRGMRGDAELMAAIDRDVRMVACGRGDEQKEDEDASEAGDGGADEEPRKLQQRAGGGAAGAGTRRRREPGIRAGEATAAPAVRRKQQVAPGRGEARRTRSS